MTRLIFLLQVDMPPLKRRRGLAGSIVNTAVSAALIGTAVGLTVYRMWRDRGKEGHPQMLEGPSADAESDSEDSTVDRVSRPPPPPYQEKNEWQALSQPPAVRVEHATPAKGKRAFTTHGEPQPMAQAGLAATPRIPATPATPRSAAAAKKRREIQAAKRPVAVVPRHRRQKSGASNASLSQPGTSTKPEFDFGHGAKQAEEDEGDDQMDWIGGKLAELIEQGRRALNTEVVVMSEAPQDEVDDGTGAWDDDNDINDRNIRSSRPSSRAGSIRSAKRSSKPTPIPIGVPSYQTQQGVGLGIVGGSISGSPPSTAVSYASANADFVSTSVPSSSAFSFASHGPVRGVAYEAASTPTQQREDPAGASWESPLVRESMEQARARLMARRAGAGV
jgi:hypothetical protein